MKNILEQYIDDIIYDDLDKWCLPNLTKFSESKNLYDYQVAAIKNAIKTLYSFYNNDNGIKEFYSYLKNKNIINNEFDLHCVDKNEKNSFQKNKRFSFLSDYYQVNDNGVLTGYQFFNRMCFWMATGSGKTIVIIKMIEAIKYLQLQNLIPKYDILLLFPREDLIKQFRKELNSYNKAKPNQLFFVNLKDYDEEKSQLSLLSDNNIYYYRSDLIRDNKTENYIDFKDYINDGKWFVFLDEAHRGEKENSLLQDYVSILSSKGFLFNFSATFTDKIDYITTCYNFNLEKFINKGYGKNVYLSQSYFDFKHDNLDYTGDEKKKQVLKSLMVLTFAKKSKEKCGNNYHSPLLMTLVNSVNTNDSDLLLFFKKLEAIAAGDLSLKMLDEAKFDLINDFISNNSYMFGTEKFDTDFDELRNITLDDIFRYVFNANTHGKIQLIKGERGKEYALQLETSSKPFALIKIGDADKFQKEKLGDNYILINSFEMNKSYFESINNNDDINILIGSRSFYEGWDSNRPNVINLINIGGNEAKKFILQSIGRGIRIEPKKGLRKRLDYTDLDKNIILETLFVFATNKSAVKMILEALDDEKNSVREYEMSLKRNAALFELLIPEYKNIDMQDELPLFNISFNSYNNFKNYFISHSKKLFMVKYNITEELYETIRQSLSKKMNLYYQINDEFNYENVEILVERIVDHFQMTKKTMSKITKVSDETIIHYKKLKLIDFNESDIEEFKKRVESVVNYSGQDLNELILKFQNKLITEEEFKTGINSKDRDRYKDIEFINMPNYYYSPLMYSLVQDIDYMKPVIDTESEVKFVKALLKYNNNINTEWMFSKIVENMDNIYIPYYDGLSNRYKNFYPDFIFWIKNGSDYKVVFVDPKGTSYASYQNKIDGFTKIFTDNGKPIEFLYNKYKVTFDLKLVTDNINVVGKNYKNYWLNLNDFSWLDINK